jgi:hypothetical protein
MRGRAEPGWVALQGSDCFGFFMQWGLGKAVLKDVWDVVAGDEGRLSQGQFLSCLYLMDLAKRGVAPPRSLPPGPFPPIAAPVAAPQSSGGAFSLSGVQQVGFMTCKSIMWLPDIFACRGGHCQVIYNSQRSCGQC